MNKEYDQCYQMSLADLLSDTVYLAEQHRIKHFCKKYSFHLSNMNTQKNEVLNLAKYYYFNRTSDNPELNMYNEHHIIIS